MTTVCRAQHHAAIPPGVVLATTRAGGQPLPCRRLPQTLPGARLRRMTESSPMAAPANWLHFRPEPVPSVSDRVVRALEAHVAAEAQDVSDCERVADSTNDPVVKLLLGMIVDD